MSDFSTLTGKFRIQKDSPNDAAKIVKRPRESLVCNQCRKAKLRCDRRQPCNSYVPRDEAPLCSYQKLPPGNGQNGAAEDRLAHLESLVKDLMQNPALGPLGKDPVTSSGKAPGEEVKLPCQSPIENPTETRYVGSTHWSAILDDIHELKNALSHQEELLGYETPTTPEESAVGQETIIFGSSHDYSLEEIIAQYLPAKVEVDRLVAIYFQGETFIIPFIHTIQFQRQYRAFWTDPAQVNPLWLSILFSICSTATLIRGTVGLSPSQEALVETSHFHTAAGKCLVKGEYHRPQQFVLEALTLYAQSKNMRSLDPSRETGIIFGMVVRMAHEMGYHRDPDSLGSFSVFEGEMRRRFWALLKQVDLMVSFQLGLPSSICLENCDTKSPRNLTDADFDEDTQVLPPSRTEDEPIGLLWFIVKDRQVVGFSKVCRHALSFHEKSEEEILQLDEEIRRMHTTIPSILRTRPLADSLADSPFLIMVRIYVENIYLKSLCVLHRRYMIRGRGFSTQACTEAGQRLVSQFVAMYKEFSPGGQLNRERWMLTNFTMNDFLLGVMVLCLVVHTRRKEGPRYTTVAPHAEETILPLLKEAHAICVEKSPVSRDARYVSRAVMAILDGHSASGTTTAVLNDDPVSSFDTDGLEFPLGWLESFHESENWDWNLVDALAPSQMR